MPEASGLAAGVERIGRDAERRFGRATRTMGADMARNLATSGKSAVEALRQVERAEKSLATARKADADAAGRLTVAQTRLNELNEKGRVSATQRASAEEAVARARRSQELSTQNLTRATRDLERAQKTQAQASGQVKMPFGSQLVMRAEAYGSDSGARFVQGFQRALGAGAALAVGGGFLASIKKVVDTGLDFDSALNTMQGVTRATSDQMAAVSKRARELGADTQLAGVSASDAAQAMTELAKGGFDVDQSMTAARGTLQLATAAQVSAAEAAKIQANALHAFGLDASEATHMADMLANTANASTGDINDFALGLQQAGAVAHGFGLSAQDTLTALGLLANAGIRGSDAGTLIKTSLQSITDQGKPAQAAIQELGLKLYDTTGKFVGYRSMLEQVAAASKRMTQEDFQAATNVLFGSDAMRAAMVAAGGGVQLFDDMFKAVGRAGGASEMAAAQMQGLPGVVEGLKNTAEGAKLALYDLVSPSLESAGKRMIGWIDKAADGMKDLRTGGGADGSAVDQIRRGWTDISSAAKELAPSLGAASKAIAMGAGSTAVAGWRALGFAMQALEPPLKLVADILGNNQWLTTGIITVLGALYLKSKLAGPAIQLAARATSAWGNAFAGWRTPAERATQTLTNVTRAAGESERAQRGWATQMRDSYNRVSDRTLFFSRTAGTAGAAMTGMKLAGSGVLSMLGGPWGAAAAGVGLAMGLVAEAHQKAAQRAEEQKQAEEELRATLDQDTGRVTEETRRKAAERFGKEDEYKSTDIGRAKGYGIDPNLLVDAATGTGDPAAYEAIKKMAMERGVKPGLEQIKFTGPGGTQIDWKSIQAQYQAMGVSSDELYNALLKEGNGWDVVNGKISKYINENPGAAQNGSIVSLQTLIDKMPDANESLVTLTQNVNEQRRETDKGAQSLRDMAQAQYGLWNATTEGIARFKDLGAAIVSVPNGKSIDLKIEPAKYDEAKKKLEDLGYTVTNLPGGIVKVTAATDEAQKRFNDLVYKVNNTTAELPVELKLANANAIAALLPGGLGAAVTMSTYANAMRPPGRATGGYVDSRGMIYGPGTGTSDSILARVSGGGPNGFIRVSNRESINNEQSTRRNMPLIDAMNRGWVPPAELLRNMTGIRGYAGGGPISIEQAAGDMAGAPYVRGGHSAAGVDCSGAASVLVNAAVGQPLYGERMATANASEWLSARGAVMGRGPAGTLRIGWKNGGPGGGHMAVTLPDGRNAESGGSVGKFTVGGGATPAQQRQLRDAEQRVQDREFDVQQAQQKLEELKQQKTVKPSVQAAAEQRLAKAQREHKDALDDLSAKQEQVNSAESRRGAGGPGNGYAQGGPDGKGFAKDMMSGALETLGFDGSVFSNPMEWGIWKLFTGGANYVGGLLKNAFGGPNQQGNNPMQAPMGAQGMRNRHGMGGAPGPGDGGLGDFSFGDGGMGVVGDALQAVLPQVGDYLPNSQNPGGNNYTTNQNSNNSNATGAAFYGPVTINDPSSVIKPPDRMNTRMTGLPKP
ncbi:hypothetical protein E3G52_000373 [Mycobacteroides abscessus]|nr:hypothetical protein [Mycobacteroides abscessus]